MCKYYTFLIFLWKFHFAFSPLKPHHYFSGQMFTSTKLTRQSGKVAEKKIRVRKNCFHFQTLFPLPSSKIVRVLVAFLLVSFLNSFLVYFVVSFLHFSSSFLLFFFPFSLSLRPFLIPWLFSSFFALLCLSLFPVLHSLCAASLPSSLLSFFSSSNCPICLCPSCFAVFIL